MSAQMPGDASSSAPNNSAVAAIGPALRVGAACAATGFLLGGTAGIVKGTTPFLFATASSIQTFALGTTFWGFRSTILHAWTPKFQAPSDLVKASTISGGLTGGIVAAIVRGRSNILPGALMFSLFGFLGQTTYNAMSVPAEIESGGQPKESFWRRMSEKPYSPVKIMNNDEYAALLQEKLLKVDVEISIIDDRIAALRQQQRIEQDAAQTPVLPVSDK